MARQASGLRLTGTIGDMVYYKVGKNYFVRKKSSVGKERIESDPAFKRVKNNASEFGNASAAASLIFKAFKTVFPEWADVKVYRRLLKIMLLAVKSDTSDHGQKKMENLQSKDAIAELFSGFCLGTMNKQHRLLLGCSTRSGSSLILKDLDLSMDLAAGLQPRNAHLTIHNITVDFEAKTQMVERMDGVVMPLGKDQLQDVILQLGPKMGGVFQLSLFSVRYSSDGDKDVFFKNGFGLVL